MRKKGLLAACSALVFVGLASAGAAAPPTPGASLPATSPLEQFIATGVLPKDVTGEPGVWNFAGPASACPGPGWNCTTLGVFPVVQTGTVNVIQCVGVSCSGSSQTGYANTFECEPEDDRAFPAANGTALQECGIDQDGESNQAKCIQKKRTTPFMRQRCSITQAGQDNQATIVQVIEQTSGAIQGAVQEAGVEQTAIASKNQLQVDQEIKQTTAATPPTTSLDQDAYQVVSGPFGEVGTSGEFPEGPATQTAEDDGDSAAQLDQKQVQRATGGTPQTQNDGITTFTPPEDCDDFVTSPADPNACVNLKQESETGNNQSQLTQTIDNGAGTAAPAAVQTQGSATGGIDGRVYQATSSPGSSQNQGNLTEKQTLVGPAGSTQFQFGPGWCCGGSQDGPGSEEINQQAHQEASEGNAEQVLTLIGISNNEDGNCAIAHDAQNNGAAASESFSFEPCFPPPIVTTACESGPPPIEGPAAMCTTVAGEFFED